MPVQEAIARAAEYWLPERFAAVEEAAAPQSETSLDALARAPSQPTVIPDALRHQFHDIVNPTVHRLRNSTPGKLKAYYFEDNGCHSVSREIWATVHADGVMESGTYWPFGKPARSYKSRPNYSLFLLQSELDALLTEQPAKKRPLPNAKMPELVAALRKLDDLRTARPSSKQYATCPNFVSSRSRTLFFVRR